MSSSPETSPQAPSSGLLPPVIERGLAFISGNDDQLLAEWRMREGKAFHDAVQALSQEQERAPTEPFDLDLKPPAGSPERDAMTRVSVPMAEYRLLVETYRKGVAAGSLRERVEKLTAEEWQGLIDAETVAELRAALLQALDPEAK